MIERSQTGSVMLSRVFVYGTLLPGGVRWPVIGPYVHTVTPAMVPGVLYDTGQGYPGAHFTDGATTRIDGSVLELHAPMLLDALDLLDEIEGVDEGLFERVVVRPEAQAEAWSYSYTRSVDGLAPVSGRWA